MMRVDATRRPISHAAVEHAATPASQAAFRSALRNAGQADQAEPAERTDNVDKADKANKTDKTDDSDAAAPASHAQVVPTAAAKPTAGSAKPAVQPEDEPMSTSSTESPTVTATAALSPPGGLPESRTAERAALPSRTGAGTDPPPAGTPAGPSAAALATLGVAPVATPTQRTQVPTITPAPSDAAPGSSMLAAGAVLSSGAPATAKPDTTPPATQPLTAMPAGLDALVTLTPLEQAVHDLISRFTERDTAHVHATKPGEDTAADPALAAFHLLAQTHIASIASVAHDAPTSASPAPAGAPAVIHIPEPPANPNHVHLVIEDGAERTVVTVALRGAEVHVAMRSTDDATTTALARNAASLDHAMRARGLALAELTAEREPTDRRPPRDPEPRERREPAAEPFKLEETP